ncbi:hydrogen peroxide-dependent heme synthase [Nakamurella lactea]|uniref:hydrogen peroxide-dependent heme synthase n=1 Tax=Nakamurella lactea TaxID=459515 RepID=UPI000413FF11|nr:hydrogen peroxide-dependent heme synthase [Nakamurella lactea]
MSSEPTPSTTSSPANDSSAPEAPAPTRSGRRANEINNQIRYTLFSVYSRVGEPDATVADAGAELQELVDELAAADVVVRGFYDVSGLRSDADLMVWWHAPAAEALQDAALRLRRTAVGRALTSAWSAMGLHRPAEFNKSHIPAFLAGAEPRGWATVYPFVRSYEWYLLPDQERRDMLVEHGTMGREHAGVLSNTVSAFALGDYEWLLALESDQLHETVDLMRHLRDAAARKHVREEIPFFTGRRIEAKQVAEVLA